MVFRTTTGNPAYLDPGQHQMTMKQSCSLAFERCFHFDLILILSKISSTTKNYRGKWASLSTDAHTQPHAGHERNGGQYPAALFLV